MNFLINLLSSGSDSTVASCPFSWLLDFTRSPKKETARRGSKENGRFKGW